MVDVIIATENEELNEYMLNRKNKAFRIVAAAQYREAVADIVRTTKADVLLLSAYLKGSEDILQTVFTARSANLRVVFLAGKIDPNDELIADLIAIGVYDILFNPIDVEQIEAVLREPGKFAEAVKLLRITKKPEGKNLSKVALKFLPLVRSGEESKKQETLKPEHRAKTALPKQVLQTTSGKTTKTTGTKTKIKQQTPLEAADIIGDDGPLHFTRPVIAVWSPAPTGKTFIATNLARALSGQTKVAFADLTPDRAAHTWLLAPEGEASFNQVMAASLLQDLPQGLKLGGITAYLSDPMIPIPDITVAALRRFISSPQVDADLMVLDLPSVLSPWSQRLLAASTVLLVADPDYAHCLLVRKAYQELNQETKVVLVVNKAEQIEAPGWNIADVLGAKPAIQMPCCPKSVYECIAAGKFAAGLEHFKPEFERLASIVMGKVYAGKLASSEQEAVAGKTPNLDLAGLLGSPLAFQNTKP